MTDVRILSDPLGGSALSQLLQRGDAPAGWMPRAPVDVEGWRRRARERVASRDWSSCWRTLEPALAASGAAAERIDRVRRAGGIVITTGQQPGLFGGPIYTWSKAMGALAFADALESATGIPTAAVFWAATDDADFAEASSTLVARAGGVDRLRSGAAPPAGTPMSLAPVGDLTAQLTLLATSCGSGTDHRPLDAVRASYGQPGHSVGGAYVALLRELLAPLGIPVLDASHSAVLDASRATIERALHRASDIESALAARSTELRGAGYEPQVEDVAGLSLVFTREGSVKRRLSVQESAHAGQGHFTPNVLLRPIVEHDILPTVSYWAGPGELAYFAQVGAVAGAMGVDAPLALPRWSCTLLEPHVEAVLGRLGLQREDFMVPHDVERRVARDAMDDQTASGLASIRAEIDRLPETLGAEPPQLGLERATEGTRLALRFRVDRLERRLLAGIARRDADRSRDVATARAALYPEGVRQERALNLIPILARHGLELLSEMHRAAGSHAEALATGAALGARARTVA